MHNDLTQHRESESGPGHPIEPRLRHALERSFATDLAAVWVHDDPAAGRLAGSLGVEAFACGTDIVFAPGRYRPARQDGLWLLAHEVTHVVQQAARHLPAAASPAEYAALEVDADRAADAVAAGRPVQPHLRHVPVLAGHRDARPPAVQFHNSFEHRALGDLRTGDLREIAANGPNRTRILEREIALQRLWQSDPESVTEEQITKVCPDVRVLRLQESDLVVTYGELNALPDYLATGGVADFIPRDILLPILQFIRQEGNIAFNKLLGRKDDTGFKDSVFTPWPSGPSLLNLLLSSKATDDLTYGLGLYGVDHYKAVLLRNACHFAPFSWYRWQQSYNMAITLARHAHLEQDPDERAHLEHAAWLQQGYADHFLQDSFAAGHLVNKNLIMQWYVEWAAGQTLTPVHDWDRIKHITSQSQPGLAGRGLYARDYAGLSNDPQTSEEQGSYATRLMNTGLVAGTSGDLNTAYQDYFAFLSSLIVSASSAAIHDHYNEHSLWVASEQHPEPYEIWGDDTLLSGNNGEQGVVATSEAAQLSQLSVHEVLTTGETAIRMSQILDRFPTKVRGADNQVLALEAWNDTQREFCFDKIFPELWYKAPALKVLEPNFANNMSVDQDLAVRWSMNLKDSGFHTTSVLSVGNRMYSASSGYLFEADALTGRVRNSLHVAGDLEELGSFETRLATDGNLVFVGVHGTVHAVPVGGARFTSVWTATLPGANGTVVDLLVVNGTLVAAANGYVYRIDPQTGQVQNTVPLGSRSGVGDYTMRLAAAGPMLIAGGHGWAYGITLADFTKAWELSLPDARYERVDVLASNGQLFAGSNGLAYRIDPASGALRDHLRVTGLIGMGDYTTSLAGNADHLFVGTHGYVYAIAHADWSRAAWTANLAGDRYSLPHLIATDDQLLAGSYGYVFRIDPATGAVKRSTMVTLGVGVGDYETQLAFNRTADEFYVGTHGYAYKLAAISV